MALTPFQRDVCRLISANRIEQGESYVAGGVALATLTNSLRISRDVDLFHDTAEALLVAWDADRALLRASGYSVDVRRERPAFIEALIAKGEDSVLLQWTRDSAYRFFPLVRHEEFGLTLHPFDLATNKALALVGRLEVRDWVDLIHCHESVQRLGYLLWAACGKDPGFSPASILEQAGRSSRYSADEVGTLMFDGSPPDAQLLGCVWHEMLGEAREVIALLPAEMAGRCVLGRGAELFSGDVLALEGGLRTGEIRFHAGSIRGSFPEIVGRGDPCAGS